MVFSTLRMLSQARRRFAGRRIQKTDDLWKEIYNVHGKLGDINQFFCQTAANLSGNVARNTLTFSSLLLVAFVGGAVAFYQNFRLMQKIEMDQHEIRLEIHEVRLAIERLGANKT